MSEELKPCPLCGEILVPFGHDLDRRVNPPVVIPNYQHPYKDPDDPMKDCCLSMLVFDARRWNTRPVENALETEKDFLKSALEICVMFLTNTNTIDEEKQADLVRTLREANLPVLADAITVGSFASILKGDTL
jgi:hypothetical protein